jgi:hypothetical protein
MRIGRTDSGLRFPGRITPQSDAGERVLKIGRPPSDAKTHGEWEKTEATRYLCAAAYLHGFFRSMVIKLFAEEEHTAIAVSYGVDAATVLKHCLAARRIATIRNLLLALPLLLFLLAFLSMTVSLVLAIVLLLLTFLSAWIIVGWEKWATEFKIVRQQFSRNNFTPDSASPHLSQAMQQTLQEVEFAQNANAMIYSGFSPFVGSGINIGGWSFAMDLDKGREELGRILKPQPVDVKDLYNEISSSLRVLNLANLAIEDKVCVNGRDIRDEPVFLPDELARPCTKIDAASMQAVAESSSSKVRHYKLFRIVDWSGELVLSAFLRLSKPGHSLFIETNYCLLVPVDEKYRSVDSMNPVPTWQDWLNLLVGSGIKSIFIWLVWPFYILNMVLGPLVRWWHREEMKHAVHQNPTFNYGAANSLRERTTSASYRHYFQKLDKEMYMKVLESKILDSILKFLDARDVDTSGLKETQTRIVNSGIIISGGGSIEANSLAVGSGSSAGGSEPKKTGVKILERFTRGAKQGGE